jgi:hypothetical protein
MTSQKPTLGYFCTLVALAASLVMVSGSLAIASPGPSEEQQKPILAQRVTEELVAMHAEIVSMEVSATPPGQATCVTIAATEAKEVGGKCDDDEFTAMKTNKPFVEKEKEGGKEVFDVTMPMHDASGKVMGTIGLDFKPAPDQEQSQVVEQATQIVREFEKRIPSRAKLFARAE